MSRIALLLALMAADAAAPDGSDSDPAPDVLVGVGMEAGATEMGRFALWSADASGAPVSGAESYSQPPGYVDAGPLLDAGGVPFRTWISLDFAGRLLSLLDGEFGVGFTPHLWLRPDLMPPGDVVGGSGRLRFDGTLLVGMRGTATEETVAVDWARGFESAPAGDSATHRAAWSGTVPLEATGVEGAYRWTVRGTLHVDLHVYSQSPRR